MTNDEINKAIALACPAIAEIDSDNGGAFWRKPDPFVFFQPVTDRNAIHQAIVNYILWDAALIRKFLKYLSEIVRRSADDEATVTMALITATELELCEAFLRTIDALKEDQ